MIPKYAFSGASQYGFLSNYLEEITFTKECKIIEDQAFEYSKLSSLSLPSQLTHIGREAFAYNSTLTELNIPSTVEYLGYAAFASCGLRDISLYPQEILEQQTVESISPSDENNRP